MIEFSDDIKQLLDERYPYIDLEHMTLAELQQFRDEIVDLRHEYSLIELGFKTLGNAAYGASANQFFYFYNVNLAADITCECRNLTRTMWNNLENWFHEGIWQRKDIQQKFGFELDESKHDWYRKQTVSCYSDTDSVYVTYGNFFKAMTPESQEKFNTPEKKLDFILKYNTEFQNGLNTEWCHEIYDHRNANTKHVFELETVSQAGIYLKKKKYVKGVIFSKGKFYKEPKISATGVELIKSTSPNFCRQKLPDVLKTLMFDLNDENKQDFVIYFRQMMMNLRREFYKSSTEEISQSINIGDYQKYVIDDEDDLILAKRCPVSVQAIARYNYLAHQNNRDDLKIYTGKIKYYNISLGGKRTGYFGFPSGELPEWAPPVDKLTQWTKNIIDPINRFLEVMDLQELNGSTATEQQIIFDYV